MKCDEAREHLAAHLDGEIDGAPRRAVDEHLAECAACAAEREALARAWRLLDLAGAPPAVPGTFEARLRERIRAGPREPIGAEEGRPRGRILGLPLPAAAAAAAVLLAAGALALRPRDGSTVDTATEAAPPAPVLEDLALLEALDLLEAEEAAALERIADLSEDDLAVLGG
ncbi:MAG TPA: zf-HC2 domain-containing protein [Planctomycetota bacterium]|nr:zf-HC2 domain-containing protein [Planctomycetota bacterium]